jgi:hypothetical protein
VLRVAGYVALMTDRYPPFALDQGGHEGGDHVATLTAPPAAPRGSAPVGPPSATTTDAAPPTSVRPTGWTGGRVVSVVAGSVAGLASLALLASGAVVGVAGAVGQDGHGFVMSPTRTLSTSGYAISSQDLVVHSDVPALPHRLLGDAKIRVTPSGGKAVFVGVAPTWAVHRYLGHAQVSVLLRFEHGDPVYGQEGVGRITVPPADVGIWAAQLTATGPRSLVWPVHEGRWTVVVMNADASRGVRADASVGAQLPALPWVVGGLLLLGALIGVLAAVLIGVPARNVARERRAAALAPPALE